MSVSNTKFLEKLQISKEAKCICAVGAGGKTSLLYRLAKEYISLGRRVLLTTTTKMYLPESDGRMNASAQELKTLFKEQNFIVAGTLAQEGKFGPLSEAVWEELYEVPDVILVEGDGSKRLPVKYHGEGEPALPKQCDQVIVVMGLSALGHPLHEVCHRFQLASEALGWAPDRVLTCRDMIELAQKGYGKWAEEKNGRYYFNQTDCLTKEEKEAFALLVSEYQTKETPMLTGSLKL